jgi:[ribosomal protein S5]-alanine N-acetyltransferase
MKIITETERLILREFNFEDTAFIVNLLNTEGWLRFIGDRGVKTPEDAERYLQNGPMKSYEINGFGLWRVSLKTDDTPIGMCGLLKRDTLEHIDIGFAQLPEFAGQGYAFEAANTVMQMAKNQMNIDHIVAITDVDNEKSIALLGKIGMRLEKEVLMPGSEKPLLYFVTAF